MNIDKSRNTHHDTGGLSTLDIIRAKLTPEEFLGYLRGNALKYLLRNKEDPADDARKAADYVLWLFQMQNAPKVDPPPQ